VKYHDQMPDLAGQMYDDLLEEKGLIASSAASMRAAVEAGGDAQAVQMLDKLSSDRAQMAALVESTAGDAATRKAQIDQLGGEANTLEQTLMKRSAAISQQKAQNAATWRDVQKALKPGDSAVEVVRFPYDEGFGPTADLVYVALVVTPDCKEPILVNLGKAKDLEAGPMLAYRDDVGQTRGFEELAAPAAAGQQGTVANTSAAYAAFWKPLEPALGGAKRVFISPDGVLTTIPMGLMADGDGKLLMEKTQLRIVNSTKDLLLPQAGGLLVALRSVAMDSFGCDWHAVRKYIGRQARRRNAERCVLRNRYFHQKRQRSMIGRQFDMDPEPGKMLWRPLLRGRSRLVGLRRRRARRVVFRHIVDHRFGVAHGPCGVIEARRRRRGIGGDAHAPIAFELQRRADIGRIDDGLCRRR
jgi:hypothetical protein